MNNQDYNSIVSAVKNWLKEKDDYELRRNKVFGINPKFYLWFFGILFLYTFFIKNAEFLKSKEYSPLPTASNYILYEKPDNKSNILLQDDSNINVEILNETIYYYQVKLTKDGINYSGFINKTEVSK